jgi:carbon monoxide dehydrogenase subunit G
MIIQGTHNFPRPPAEVYAALNDPAILQQSIPGCDKLSATAPDEYSAQLKIGLAAIKGVYAGKVRLSDQQPPNRFTLHLDGKGGPGFVQGTARVELKEKGQTTELHYNADVKVGGLIAAVGSRMVEAAAKKMAADFFQKFSAALEGKK